MNAVLIVVLTVVVVTSLGIISNIVANRIEPHVKNRTRLLVTLFGGLFGAAIVLAIASTTRESITDKLEISSIKTVEDSKTEISEFAAGQGIISVYWEISLSNTGDNNLSVTAYDVLQTGQDFPATWYTGMNQGLFLFEDGNPKQMDLPIDISAGSSRKLFVRLGLMMTPASSQLVKENFAKASQSDVSLGTIWRYLYTKGTDFYGNKVETQFVGGSGEISARLPTAIQILEQVFVLSFKTSRGASVEEPLSWYKFGGVLDPRRH